MNLKKKGGKAHILSGETNIAVIRFLSKKIGEIEKAVWKRVKLKEEYKKLLTASGIGKILALTIMRETEICEGRELFLILPMREEWVYNKQQEERGD